MWENTAPGTELPRDFYAGIGPLQLGVVLVRCKRVSKKDAYHSQWAEKPFLI